MYAVIALGSHQYKVEPDSEITVFRRDAEEGNEITFDDVKLVKDGDDSWIGQPTIEDARVKATVLEHFRGDKITVFNYKRREGKRRKLGHRDDLTRLRVHDISPPN